MSTNTEMMIARGSNYTNKQRRMEEDERELAELIAKQSSKTPDPEDEVLEKEAEVPKKSVEDEQEVNDEDDDELSSEEKSFKKRYGDLRRHMAKKEREWEKRLKEVETNSGEDSEFSVPSNVEEWAKNNPEAASVIESLAERKASERISAAEAQIETLTEAKTKADRVTAESTIRATHSDFDKLRDSDEFHDWVEDQPKWVQDALYENSNDAQSVIRVIDLYKVDNGITPSAKKRKAKEAASPVSKRAATPKVDHEGLASVIKESDVAKFSDKEFEERYEEIQTAMRSGKFIYDVTGS